ncbi:hypothetical protein SAMN05444266_101253 [Chitinophaga jiangningensis]|uniref:Uncharacterized protein n=1 Tax=Chitinophaga jiangningensis TaxID=1419482 RepID=A0A1M6VLI8_9BACT|nr:hypothetical protein SAMN05444266_101253 [Chitinophaga jiangningensis]
MILQALLLLITGYFNIIREMLVLQLIVCFVKDGIKKYRC